MEIKVKVFEEGGKLRMQWIGTFKGKEYGNHIIIPIDSTESDIKEHEKVMIQHAEETLKNLISK